MEGEEEMEKECGTLGKKDRRVHESLRMGE